MNKSIHMVLVGAAVIGSGGSALAAEAPPADAPHMHHAAAAEGAKPAPTDEELIASAMKAAPKKVVGRATIDGRVHAGDE